MLFQHLYNWIKYKTLPPSILFKNRLYVERDSKFRRITNNLGLTFRNVKWTNYEMNNLHLKFFSSYYIIIVFVITVSFIFFTYFNLAYYTTSTVFNGVAFVLWSGIDLVDYYIDFIIWSTVVFLSTFLKGLHAYFYTPFVNADKQIVKLIYLQKFKDEKLYNVLDDHSFAQKDFKWVIFTWLNNSKTSLKDLQLEKLFPSVYNQQQFNTVALFFHHLFNLNYLLDKLLDPAITKKNNFINGLFTPTLTPLTHLSNWVSNEFLLFYHTKFQNRSYFTKTHQHYWTNYRLDGFKWNLHKNLLQKTMLENTQNSLLINGLVPYHFLSNQNLVEFYSVGNNLMRKITTTKSYRWLYKYSLIHRRNFKNTHKITLTKKLINVGFLNKSLSDKNLWYSVFSKKLNKTNLPHTLNNLFYKTKVFFKDAPMSNELWKESFIFSNKYNENIHFYENSFFWLTKRFTFFNHLTNNKLISSLQKNKNPLKNPYMPFNTNNSFCWSYQNLFLETQLFSLFNLNHNTQGNTGDRLYKDLVILFENQTFFETANSSLAALIVSNLSFYDANNIPSFFFNVLETYNSEVPENNFLINNVQNFQDIGITSGLFQASDLFDLFIV